MHGILTWMARAVGTVGAVLIGLLGGCDAILEALLVFMGVDYLTGVLAAIHGKSAHTPGGRFSSRVSFWGLTRKMLVLLILIIAVELDKFAGLHDVFRTGVAGYYIANEGLSILENIDLMGVKAPPLKKVLEQMREKDIDTKGDKKE
jgi:toxin secretion/phage lysis holin